MSVLKKDTESREKGEIVKSESEGEAEDVEARCRYEGLKRSPKVYYILSQRGRAGPGAVRFRWCGRVAPNLTVREAGLV